MIQLNKPYLPNHLRNHNILKIYPRLTLSLLLCLIVIFIGCATFVPNDSEIPLNINFAEDSEEQQDFSVYDSSVERLRTVDIYLEKISSRRGYYPEAYFKFYDSDGVSIDTLRDRNTKFATEDIGFIGRLRCPVPRGTRSVEVKIAVHRGIFQHEFEAIEEGMSKAEIKKKLGEPEIENKNKMSYPGVEFRKIDIILDNDENVKSVKPKK